MSEFTGPLSCATHSPYTGTSRCSTCATPTSGGGGGAAACFSPQAASNKDANAMKTILRLDRDCVMKKDWRVDEIRIRVSFWALLRVRILRFEQTEDN